MRQGAVQGNRGVGAPLGDLSCSVWVWLRGMCEMGLPEGPSEVALPQFSYEPLKGDSEIVWTPHGGMST